MAIIDIFAKRQRRQRGDVPDVYTYTALPRELRVQIVQIWQEVIGNPYEGNPDGQIMRSYKAVTKALRHELGVFRLPSQTTDYTDEYAELLNYFMQEQDVERALSAVELGFRVIDTTTRVYAYRLRQDASEVADNAISELNHRFKEHGVGFEYANRCILRIDSQLVHAEVVKPALQLLADSRFSGAQQEFLKAHEHYRTGNHKEALNECLKAFESVMITICDGRRWSRPKTPTARDLLTVCFENRLIPSFWESHFTALRSTLESGVPTARNQLGGHGQGTSPVEVPAHLVAYVLHMTASAIVFLAQADAALG